MEKTTFFIRFFLRGEKTCVRTYHFKFICGIIFYG